MSQQFTIPPEHSTSRRSAPRTLKVIRRCLLPGIILLMSSLVIPFLSGKQSHSTRKAVKPVTSTVALPQLRETKHTRKKHRRSWHPPHRLRVWTTEYSGRAFRVTQLPRCEHIEAVMAHNPEGETLKRAKVRLGGVAACTGSFHNPVTFALADFLQYNGSMFSGARTGRPFLAVKENGKLVISSDYRYVKGRPGVDAITLGQRLVPLQRDGFSLAFMNQITDRMAIGINDNFIFIVQGKSDIWKLAKFMGTRLPCSDAVNSDGGHVVRGRAPVHIVFRWKRPKAHAPAVKKALPRTADTRTE